MTPGFGSTRPQAMLLIHLCVVLWGFTAIIGRVITLPALPLVSWRLFIVLAILMCLPRVWRGWKQMSAANLRKAGIAGLFVAAHWWTFYAAIKMANASVAVACLALGPVFLCFVEPVLTGRAMRRRELLLSSVAVPGVWMVIGGSPAEMNLGIMVGVISAFLVAVFATLNKMLATEADPYALTATEFGVGLSGLLAAMVITAWTHDIPIVWIPAQADLAWLLVLAIVCTLAPFIMAFVALRVLSAWETHLIVNLEPVYAVILAALLLGEGQELAPMFYLGVAVLVGTTALAARKAPS